MTILFDDRYNNENVDYKFFNTIKDVIIMTIDYEKFDYDCEISVSFVSNCEIQDINNRFRNINSPTDVLSFPQIEFDENRNFIDQFVQYNEDNEIILGDIIISIEKAIQQSNEYGHSLKREIAFLTVHSMLHLLGYDHMTDEQEYEMFSKQDNILSLSKIERV